MQAASWQSSHHAVLFQHKNYNEEDSRQQETLNKLEPKSLLYLDLLILVWSRHYTWLLELTYLE
jgi:hypothetical protein